MDSRRRRGRQPLRPDAAPSTTLLSKQKMPAAKPVHTDAADCSAAVDEFMAALVHPHKAQVEALRKLMLEVDPAVREGIKWNAPSFRSTEYFATTHLRASSGIGVILHLGAKAQQLAPGGLAIDDPAGLLKWLAADRAMVQFADAEAFDRAKDAFRAVLRQWIKFV
jgi:hypothetical protein